jgi:hypothetical protein
VLARFERLDDRMMRREEVLRRVLVLRRVAAADVATVQAPPQVDPAVAELEAFLAAVRRRGRVIVRT